jgi:hypothetical protein
VGAGTPGERRSRQGPAPARTPRPADGARVSRRPWAADVPRWISSRRISCRRGRHERAGRDRRARREGARPHELARRDRRGSGVRRLRQVPRATAARRRAGVRAQARGRERPKGKIGDSSGASLHAKTFGVDRSRIFIGSFNLDPRSARLNTEVGVVLESACARDAAVGRVRPHIPRRATKCA